MRFAFLVVCAMAMAAVYEVHHYVIAQITSGGPRIGLQQAPALRGATLAISSESRRKSAPADSSQFGE